MAASVAGPARRRWYVALLNAGLAAIIARSVAKLGFFAGPAP